MPQQRTIPFAAQTAQPALALTTQDAFSCAHARLLGLEHDRQVGAKARQSHGDQGIATVGARHASGFGPDETSGPMPATTPR
jgi:hypothetical protein